jgi:hypothetical protein
VSIFAIFTIRKEASLQKNFYSLNQMCKKCVVATSYSWESNVIHFFPVLYNTRSSPSTIPRLLVSLENPTHGRINRPKHRDPIPHAQAGKQHSSLIAWKKLNPNPQSNETIYFVEDEYLVTALVPSETACLASSPGRMRRTL